MGTVNRMLRTRDRMHELFLEARKHPESSNEYLLAQTSRVEHQALLLLQALAAIYVAWAAFAGGTLMTLIGGSLSTLVEARFQQILVLVGVALVFVGVGGLVFGSFRLFQATRLSISNLRAEAEVIRASRSPMPRP